MSRPLFILRTYNDVDHMTPVIWRFVRSGARPVLVFHTSFDYDSDYRIDFLRRQGELEIHRFADREYERHERSGRGALSRITAGWYSLKRNRPRQWAGRIYRRLFFDCSWEMRWLREKEIGAAVFEWSAPGARGDVVERFFFAAKALGLPTISLPHGCNIYVNADVDRRFRKRAANGRPPDFSDRNAFDVYVVQSPHHRDQYIRSGLFPWKVHAWGSARFCSEWHRANLDICGEFHPRVEPGRRVRVVAMLPHWDYNVDKMASLGLLTRLAQESWIHLVVKEHTRGATGRLPSSWKNQQAHRDNVEMVNDAHSPALVAWSDAVVSFGTSIGVEVLLQGKVLVNPHYLDSNHSVFEATGAGVQAAGDSEVLAALQAVRSGEDLTQAYCDAKNRLFRAVIYGGRDPFDVLNHYYDEIATRCDAPL